MSVPGRNTILASSIVFDFASVFLILEFAGIALKDMAIETVNALGAASCVGWFVGFALLIDWLVFHTFPVWGPSRRALTGATLKLIASVLFNVQPFSGMSSARVDPLGVPWSNFAGICFFHLGNCIDAVGMAPMLNRRALLSHANLPVYGIFCYVLATWLLVFADGFAFFAVAMPNFITAGQLIGSSLLLVASLLFTAWAYWVPPAATKPLQEQMLPEGTE